MINTSNDDNCMMNTNYNDYHYDEYKLQWYKIMMNNVQTIMVNINYDGHKTCVQLLSIC